MAPPVTNSEDIYPTPIVEIETTTTAWPANVTRAECLQYNYENITAGDCTAGFLECSKRRQCPYASGYHCFTLWSVLPGNKSSVVSAGCNPSFSNAPDEECRGECRGQPKGRGNHYYCCCTGHLCNANFTVGPRQFSRAHTTTTLPPPPSTTAAMQFQVNYSQPTHMTESLLVIAVLVIITLCAYILVSRFPMSRNRRNRASFTDSLAAAMAAFLNPIPMPNSSPDITPLGQRRSFKNRPSQVDLRMNRDTSVLIPLQSPSDSSDGGPGQIQETQLSNPPSSLVTATNIPLPGTSAASTAGQASAAISESMSGPIASSAQDPGSKPTLAPTGEIIPAYTVEHFPVTYVPSPKTKSPPGTLKPNDKSLRPINITEVDLLELVGKGRYGTVHKAVVPDIPIPVAVKIQLSTEKHAWANEVEIYSLHRRIRHKNICRLMYSGKDPATGNYWLVIDFASRDTLNSYLKNNILKWNTFIDISLGIARGLAHLHEQEIAHRDIKSKNILLNAELIPSIADFGIASTLDSPPGRQMDYKKKYLQVGTPRYMAPEVLECSVTFSKESFTKIDVYSFSLVCWELLSRVFPIPSSKQVGAHDYPDINTTRNLIMGDGLPPHSLHVTEKEKQQSAILMAKRDMSQNIEPGPYRLPYEDVAGENPDTTIMRQVVVLDKCRPFIKKHWRHYPASEYCRCLEDGWEYDYDARISASCFIERITAMPRWEG